MKIVLRPRARTIITLIAFDAVPSNALLDDQGRPIFDAYGRFILIQPADTTIPDGALLDDNGNTIIDALGNSIIVNAIN